MAVRKGRVRNALTWELFDQLVATSKSLHLSLESRDETCGATNLGLPDTLVSVTITTRGTSIPTIFSNHQLLSNSSAPHR